MLKGFSHYMVHSLFGMQPGSRLADASGFFIYDIIKIFLLLSVIIFTVSIVRSYFPPERTKRILSHKKEFIGNILATLLGIVAPFCSCSGVPLSIGFVEADVPLGVTFSFLISSPIVNEIALITLWGRFDWKIALLYTGTGVVLGIASSIVIGKFKIEKYVQEYVWEMKAENRDVMETSLYLHNSAFPLARI